MAFTTDTTGLVPIDAPINKAFNAELLEQQIRAAFPPPAVCLGVTPGDTVAEIYVQPLIQQSDVDKLTVLVAAHDASVLTADQTAANQQQAAADIILPILAITRTLPASEQVYAIMGRMLATNNGASTAVINGIVDKATAQAYLVSTPRWQALPAASKAWEADLLNMIAGCFQLVITRLT